MRWSSRRLRLFTVSVQLPLVLAASLVFASIPAAAASVPVQAGAEAVACGVERWPVKTLSDADAGLVDFAPVAATVSELIGLPAPSTRPPNNRVPPVELTTFDLVAQASAAKLEPDGDIHLVIAELDDPTLTMIVEFPDPSCVFAADPSALEAMAAARDSFVAAFGTPPSTHFIDLAGIVEITGVGFFDRIHGQRGVAPNGIELHPALGFALLAAEAGPGAGSPRRWYLSGQLVRTTLD